VDVALGGSTAVDGPVDGGPPDGEGVGPLWCGDGEPAGFAPVGVAAGGGGPPCSCSGGDGGPVGFGGGAVDFNTVRTMPLATSPGRVEFGVRHREVVPLA
jgi:hypothetical protein